MELSKEEILKLDEILKFLNENINKRFENEYLPNHFEIPLEHFEFLYNKICNFSIDETNIGNVLDNGLHYQSIECDYRTDRFIKNGGFEEYYRMKKEREMKNNNPIINIGKIVGNDNYENISAKSAKNLNINSNNPTINNAIPNAKPKHTINSIILQFWKLISENKLISSILVVVIFWIIKKVFNIDMKI